MKKCSLKFVFIIVFVLVSAANAADRHSFSERMWLSGKIKGGIRGKVVTVVLVNLKSGTVHTETATNKYGWYAFSDMGQGSPSKYKLVIYQEHEKVKQLELKGVSKGGWAPVITIP